MRLDVRFSGWRHRGDGRGARRTAQRPDVLVATLTPPDPSAATAAAALRTPELRDLAGIVKIHADYDRCEGNGLCVALAPAYFSLNQQGLLSVQRTLVDDSDVKAVDLAVTTCPVEALRLER
jgi:ferredoxin